MKTPVLESLLNKVVGLKKKFKHMCFPVNIAKFLRTSFLQNTSVAVSIREINLMDMRT